MTSGIHCASIPLLKNMGSHKDTVLFHIQCTQLQALAHCKMKYKEFTLLMVFPADKRSSQYHTHSLAALISALVSSQLPSSNRIIVQKIISSQAQVILLFLTDPILFFCAHVHNFTV